MRPGSGSSSRWLRRTRRSCSSWTATSTRAAPRCRRREAHAVSELLDRRARAWAIAAVVGGIALLLAITKWEEPKSTLRDMLFELVDIVPVVMTSVGVALLFRVTRQQRDENVKLIRD